MAIFTTEALGDNVPVFGGFNFGGGSIRGDAAEPKAHTPEQILDMGGMRINGM